MSTIRLKCNDQVLYFAETPVIASGGFEEDYAEFEFCSRWDGFTKVAVFYRSEEKAYHVILDETNTCQVPPEVTADEGVIYFGVFGVNAEGQRRTSETLSYNIRNGAVTSASQPTDPTPDLYTKLLAVYTDVVAKEDMILTDLAGKQEALTFDETPTEGSLNPVTSDGIKKAIVSSQTGYSKEETLTDETKERLGLGEDAVPDEAFQKIADAILPVGAVVRSTEADAADNLGGSWALCNGDLVLAEDAPELFAGAGQLTKYTRAIGEAYPVRSFNPGAIDVGDVAWKVCPNGGTNADGVFAFPVYCIDETSTSTTNNARFGIMCSDSYLGPWTVHEITGFGLSYGVGSSPLIVSYCGGRWFFSMHQYSSGTLNGNYYESRTLWLLTAESLTGPWVSVFKKVQSQTNYLTSSKVFEHDGYYYIAYTYAKSGSAVGLYLSQIDKETMTENVIQLTERNASGVTGVSILDDVLYLTFRANSNYDAGVYKVIFGDTPTALQLVDIQNVGTYGSYKYLSDVRKHGGTYFFLYAETSSTVSSANYSRAWYVYTSPDGAIFTKSSTSVSITSQTKMNGWDFIEIDGALYFDINGNVYAFDAATQTLSQTCVASFNVTNTLTSTEATGIMISDDAVFTVADYSTTDTTPCVKYVRADAVKLPSISEDSVYNYIKLKE